VFLRVLEYYSGILFLTTNRVGALDEAFRSRVHISLWYPHLSLNDTVQILKSNLNRLPRVENAEDKTSTDDLIKILDDPIEKFVVDEYTKYARANKKKRGPWNGRQIRNAVQIAACLAFYEKEVSKHKDGLPAILTADHFRSVAETTAEFEKFLKSTKIGDESFLAHQRQDRDDDWEDGEDGESADTVQYSGYTGHFDAGERTPLPRFGLAVDTPGSGRTGTTRRTGGPATPTRRRSSLQSGRPSEKNPGSAQPYSKSSRSAQLSHDYPQDHYYDEDGISQDGISQDGRGPGGPRRPDPRGQMGQSEYRANRSSRQRSMDVDGLDDLQNTHSEDDHLEWGPDSYQGSRGGMSSPFGQGRQYLWKEQNSGPGSEDRMTGYDGERRSQRRRAEA